MACQCFVNLFGYGLLAYAAARGLSILYNVLYPFFLYPGIKDLAKATKGKWAVVTGSTDGIGLGYAFELARKGMNLVLVARNQEKLDDVKREINTKHPSVEIKLVKFDFTANSVQQYQDMYKSNKLDELDVGVLVNNVGMSYDFPNNFDDVPAEKVFNLVQVNMLSLVMMTQLFVKKMRERKAGAIINVSSGSDMFPLPLLAVYAASKIFVHYMTAAMSEELKTDGVICQTVVPFYVATKMSKIRRTSLFVPNGSSYARAALRTLGAQQRTHGFWTHQLQGELIALLPQWLLVKAGMSQLQNVRKAALRKLAKEQ